MRGKHRLERPAVWVRISSIPARDLGHLVGKMDQMLLSAKFGINVQRIKGE